MDDREELSALRRLAELEAKAESRRTPKQMIGVEGFTQAMQETMRGKGWLERQAAGFGAFPRQLYEGTKQAVGKGDPTAIRATRVMEEEAPAGALAGGLSTVALSALAPSLGGIAGQAALGGATGAAMPTEGEESRVKNAMLGAGLSGGVAAGLKGLGMGASKLLQRGTTKAAETASEQAVRDQTLAEARQLGLNVPPTVAGGGRGAKGLESVAGKAATAQEQSIRNQHAIDRIARAEAGLKPSEAITEKTLEAAREQLAGPYREIARVSKKASTALEDLKTTRFESKENWQFYGRSGDPKVRKAAEALDKKIDGLEKTIEDEAIAYAKRTFGMRSPKATEMANDLLQSLKSARTAIAKNHDVEKALNIGSGSIDAKTIGALLNKRGEAGMSGGLRTIGKFQQAFPDFARIRPSGQSAPGVGYLKYPLALALGAEGYNLGQQHGIGPYGTAAGLLALAGGPARSAALSKFMQSAPKYQPGMAVRLSDLATNDPRLRSMIPLSATAASLQPDRQ